MGGGVDYTNGIFLACLRGLYSQYTSVVMLCTYRAFKPRPILFTHFNGSDCLRPILSLQPVSISVPEVHYYIRIGHVNRKKHLKSVCAPFFFLFFFFISFFK